MNGKQWNAIAAHPGVLQAAQAEGHDASRRTSTSACKDPQKHGKNMIGWDEVLHPDLPKDIVVQSWRGQKSLAERRQRAIAAFSRAATTSTT